jgi:hypothetical protein
MAAAAGAIANAFFDPTGVRMREYPLTPKRVLRRWGGAEQERRGAERVGSWGILGRNHFEDIRRTLSISDRV